MLFIFLHRLICFPLCWKVQRKKKINVSEDLTRQNLIWKQLSNIFFKSFLVLYHFFLLFPSSLVPEKRGACRPHSKPWGWSPDCCSYPGCQTQPASAAWPPPGSAAPPPGRSGLDAPTARGTSGPPADSSRMCSPHPRTSLPLEGETRPGRTELFLLHQNTYSEPIVVHLRVYGEMSVADDFWFGGFNTHLLYIIVELRLLIHDIHNSIGVKTLHWEGTNRVEYKAYSACDMLIWLLFPNMINPTTQILITSINKCGKTDKNTWLQLVTMPRIQDLKL